MSVVLPFKSNWTYWNFYNLTDWIVVNERYETSAGKMDKNSQYKGQHIL